MFAKIIFDIFELVDSREKKLKKLKNPVLFEKKNSQNRTIKQLIGHLIDSASNNHQRMVRLQYNSKLEFPDYRQDNDRWIGIQNYQGEDWNALLKLWKFYNYHLVHVIKNVDFTMLKNSWNDFENNTVTLKKMIEGYLDHLTLHLNEIDELTGK